MIIPKGVTKEVPLSESRIQASLHAKLIADCGSARVQPRNLSSIKYPYQELSVSCRR